MGKKVLMFGEIEIKKKYFITTIKVLFFKKDVDIEKVLASINICSGKKKVLSNYI